MEGMVCNSFVNFQSWVVDSGANQHMTASESLLHDNVDVLNLNLKVCHPNGSTAQINKIGNMQLSDSLVLFDVFVVPDFNINLLSVHKLCKDSKCEVVFNEHKCTVQDSQSKEMVETGNQTGGLYYMNNFTSVKIKANCSKIKCCVSKLTWHARLGHPAEQALNVLKNKLFFGNKPFPPCDVCHKAKQRRDSFPLSSIVTHKIGDLVHLDVWAPTV